MADEGLPYLLPRLVGIEKAFELAVLGDDIEAQEALRLGLVGRVVPDGQLMDAAMELAERIAKGPTLAIAVTKRVLYYAETHDFFASSEFTDYANDRLFQTEDTREGVQAFLEKRAPQFEGR